MDHLTPNNCCLKHFPHIKKTCIHVGVAFIPLFKYQRDTSLPLFMDASFFSASHIEITCSSATHTSLIHQFTYYLQEI